MSCQNSSTFLSAHRRCVSRACFAMNNLFDSTCHNSRIFVLENIPANRYTNGPSLDRFVDISKTLARTVCFWSASNNDGYSHVVDDISETFDITGVVRLHDVCSELISESSSVADDIVRMFVQDFRPSRIHNRESSHGIIVAFVMYL